MPLTLPLALPSALPLALPSALLLALPFALSLVILFPLALPLALHIRIKEIPYWGRAGFIFTDQDGLGRGEDSLFITFKHIGKLNLHYNAKFKAGGLQK